MEKHVENDSQTVLTLDDLQPGDEAVIAGYRDDIANELRLLEMGLIIGSAVKLVKVAPFGDPIQIRVRGYDLSLRRAVARGIFTKPTHLKNHG